MLLIGGFATASTGGFGAVLVAAYAYITDITPKRWLTVRMGIIEFMIFIGAAASSASSISWLGSNGCDFHPTAWLMMATAVLSFLYILVLPESLTNERKKELLIKPKRGDKSLDHWSENIHTAFVSRHSKILVITGSNSRHIIGYC